MLMPWEYLSFKKLSTNPYVNALRVPSLYLFQFQKSFYRHLIPFTLYSDSIYCILDTIIRKGGFQINKKINHPHRSHLYRNFSRNTRLCYKWNWASLYNRKNSSSNHSLTRKIVKVGGDTFRYMVQWSIWGQARQKSEYDHNKKQHRTTSMMNSKSIRSDWKNPKITATAKTPWYWSYSSNNSYWLLDNLWKVCYVWKRLLF